MDFCRCCRTQENWPSRAFCRSLGGLILHLLAYWRSGQHQHQYCHHYHRYQHRHRHHHFPLTVFENVNLLPDDAVVGRRPLCSRITFVESSLRQDILGIVEHHYDDDDSVEYNQHYDGCVIHPWIKGLDMICWCCRPQTEAKAEHQLIFKQHDNCRR